MSRKGNKPISLPAGTTVKQDKDIVVIQGNLGFITMNVPEYITINVGEKEVKVSRKDNSKLARTMHGTVASNLANAIHGVTLGFTKKLKIVGVGYKAAVGGNTLEVHAGYSGSGPRKVRIPSTLKVSTPTPNEIVVSGFDKQQVGEFAANVRAIRKPEPYNGKGIMYFDEVIRRKVGKTAESTKK